MLRTNQIPALLCLATWWLPACGPASPSEAPAPAAGVQSEAAEGQPGGETGPAATAAQGATEPMDVLDDQGLPQVPPGSDLTIDEDFFKNGRRRYRRLVKTTADGILGHGAYVRWYKNGVVEQVGAFRDGQPEGLFVERFEGGPVRSEIPYRAGKVHGIKREYAEAGYRKRQVSFEDGLQHGPYLVTTSWYEGELVPLIEGQFEAGRKTGPWKYYYNTGEPRDAGVFENDLREGRWTTWHKNGELQLEADHHLGQWHGQVVEYSEQGQRLSEATYAGGVAVGPRTEWFENGQTKSVREFVAGVPEGAVTTWFETGGLQSEGEMRAGKQEGVWTFWNADGSVNEEWSGTYVDGELVDAGQDS